MIAAVVLAGCSGEDKASQSLNVPVPVAPDSNQAMYGRWDGSAEFDVALTTTTPYQYKNYTRSMTLFLQKGSISLYLSSAPQPTTLIELDDSTRIKFIASVDSGYTAIFQGNRYNRGTGPDTLSGGISYYSPYYGGYRWVLTRTGP